MRAVLLVILLAACTPEPLPEPVPGEFTFSGEVIGTVNGIPITQGQVDAVTSRFDEAEVARIKADPVKWQALLDRIALGTVLYQDALAAKIDKEPDTQAMLAMGDREILSSGRLDQIADAAVTDEAIQKAYDKHKVELARPSRKVHHMVFRDKKAADAAVARVGAGEPFEAVATEVSEDKPTNGGDLGWIDQGTFKGDLGGPVFAAATGSLVGPLENGGVFHVFRIDDAREVVSLEDVKPQLIAEVKQQAVKDYVDKTKLEMKVEWTKAPSASTGTGPKDAPSDPAPATPGAAPAAPEAPAPKEH